MKNFEAVCNSVRKKAADGAGPSQVMYHLFALYGPERPPLLLARRVFYEAFGVPLPETSLVPLWHGFELKESNMTDEEFDAEFARYVGSVVSEQPSKKG